ncbi:MAG: LamG domain-containing protein [Planctomycetes bacterium]|nr:LamG domain-containing protein [Planctomycetota bacterium]
MKTRSVFLCVTAFYLTLALQTSASGDTISNSGLLVEYAYETSGGLAVADGQSAAGAQIDDTGLNPAGANHATGSAFAQFPNLLTYSLDVMGDGGVGSGRALSFPLPESNTNYVSIPIDQGSALDNIGTGDFYIEAHFKTTDTNRANIFASYSAGNPNTAFNLELHTNNRVRIYLQDGVGVDEINSTAPGITYADNEWHKIIAVRDSNILTLTLDGVVVGAPITSNRSFEQTNSIFRIGQDNRGPGTPKFTGLIDDITLTSSNNALFSRVAVYNFDTADGVATVGGASAIGTIDDTGGNAAGPFGGIAAAGSPAAEPEYSADVPAALAGRSTFSLEFEEGKSTIEDGTFPVTPEVASVSMGDFTIETWFKTSDTGRSALVSGWANGTDRAFGLELHTNNRVRFFIEGGPDYGNGD